MQIALFGRLTKTTQLGVIHEFVDFARERDIRLHVLQAYADELQHAGLSLGPEIARFKQAEQIAQANFVYSLGGDGTILDTVRFIGRLPLPVLGVNAGRLGFLASVNQHELQAATLDLLANAWKPDVRTMLSLQAKPQPVFVDNNRGLNEVTIHKANSNEMITIHAYVNGEFLNSYWTDGLVISTPTGSTAYSLACGGPIMSPTAASMVITPIAPHSLTVRPMVIPDSAVISLAIESRSGQALVALDNRTELISDHTELAVRKADIAATLVRLPARSYFQTLRGRLSWGLDSRS